ncbi:MAG: hypothetical protein FP814_02810 [Desulfobacterium sp.]|nr:hypothetical protein [Desulfobacterium sp.]
MITDEYKRAIITINERLKDSDISWAITGSLGFALHGIDLKINDIDLQTNEAGAYQIQEAFNASIIKKVIFSESGNIRSHFGALKVDGVKVEIMGALQKKLPNGEWEPPVDIENHRGYIIYEGMNLPVLSLSYEEKAYRKLGRIEKADKIKKWLIG